MIKTIYAMQKNWSCMFVSEWMTWNCRQTFVDDHYNFLWVCNSFCQFYRSLDSHWDHACRKFLFFSQRVTHFHTLNNNYCTFHLRMIVNWQLPIAVYKKEWSSFQLIDHAKKKPVEIIIKREPNEMPCQTDSNVKWMTENLYVHLQVSFG